jgi:VanZ family protein
MTQFKTVAAVVILLSLIVIVPLPVWASQEDAATAISSAKNDILNCYNAAKEAEDAGANIIVITRTLNEAGLLLSQAEYAYDTNDFDAAIDLALQSQNSLTDCLAEANTLTETATQQQHRDFLINVVGSIIGTFAVIVVGLTIWLFMKKKYGVTA